MELNWQAHAATIQPAEWGGSAQGASWSVLTAPCLGAVLVSVMDLCLLQPCQGPANSLRVQTIDFQCLPALFDLLVCVNLEPESGLKTCTISALLKALPFREPQTQAPHCGTGPGAELMWTPLTNKRNKKGQKGNLSCEELPTACQASLWLQEVLRWATEASW